MDRKGLIAVTHSGWKIAESGKGVKAFPAVKFSCKLGPIQGGPKSKPLSNDQRILLNRIIACQ